MIEGNLHEAGFNVPEKSNGLQPLEWSVLTARLAAVHDLRGAFKGRLAGAAGNVARFTSGAQNPNGETLNETMASVNPVGSADDKRCGSKAAATEIDGPSVSESNMTPSDREL